MIVWSTHWCLQTAFVFSSVLRLMVHIFNTRNKYFALNIQIFTFTFSRYVIFSYRTNSRIEFTISGKRAQRSAARVLFPSTTSIEKARIKQDRAAYDCESRNLLLASWLRNAIGRWTFIPVSLAVDRLGHKITERRIVSNLTEYKFGILCKF